MEVEIKKEFQDKVASCSLYLRSIESLTRVLADGENTSRKDINNALCILNELTEKAAAEFIELKSIADRVLDTQSCT